MEHLAGQGHRRGGKLPGAEHRLLKGYAPLAAALVAVVAVVVVFPSKAPKDADQTAAREGKVSQAASGWNKTVKPCAGGGLQVEGDSYSPPCFEFKGDNGGETTKGVSADEIVVTYRQTAEPNVLAVLAQLMGIPFDETNEDFQRTVSGLIDYFNESFQFYGRKLKLEIYQGQGSLVTELTGGGQEAANLDGLKAGGEIEAFADITAATQPYSEGLVKQEVVAFGAPYMSREWFTDRRPYAWSIATDCSRVAEAGSSYGLQRLIGRPAIYAGGKLKDKTRKMAVISPNNPEYQQCAEAGFKVIEDAGEKIDFITDYVLDLARVPQQAKSIATQLISKGITTISCFCDPLMLLNLTQEIDSQGLEPEWVVTGVGFVDLDLIGQGLAKKNDQWSRAFGVSPISEQEPEGKSAGYRAFKSVRPDEEPSQAVDVFYYQLYQLALGIQMAGPDLTPANLETGLFSYPVKDGPAGKWDYFPESYTPIIDAREVWWDPDATSAFNDEKGTYASNGQRYVVEQIPPGQPAVFGN